MKVNVTQKLHSSRRAGVARFGFEVGQVERLSATLLNDVNDRVLLTVDRAFRRLLILVGLGLAGAALIATWAMRRPPQRPVSEPR